MWEVRRRMLARIWRWVTWCLLGALVLIAIGYLAGLRIVTTQSVATGLWWVHNAPASRGMYVLVCLPSAVAHEGRVREYLDAGMCVGGAAPVMKRVAAVAGDRVVVRSSGIIVNGEELAGTGRLSLDRHGRTVRNFTGGGNFKVKPGEVWLVGDAARSWDSRYYGPVPASGILGVGRLVWRDRPP